MKRRLLMLLSVFMTITSVGWLQAQDTSEDLGYTKTDNDYTVTTAEGLQNVLKELNEVKTAQTTTITLANDLNITGSPTEGIKSMGPNQDWQGIFFFDNAITKYVNLTINGNGKQIYGNNTSQSSIADYASKTYVFYIHGGVSAEYNGKLTFSDLKVSNTNIIGFNIFNIKGVVFNKVSLLNNAEGGLHLNSSELEATDFTTNSNGKFAVKLSRERANKPKFTLKSGTIDETNVPQIAYYDRYANGTKDNDITASLTATDIAACAEFPTGENWYRSLQYATLHTSKNGALAYVWTKSNDAVTVNTAGQLDSTINLGFATVNKVNLAATTYTLDRQLVINRPLTIEGKEATTIKANGSDWSGANSVKNLISIENGQAGEDVILKNLTVADSKAAGINAQSPMTTSLVNVTLKGNATAGLLVHSKVSAEGLHTEGNVWGGVNVGTDGTPVYSPKFTFSPDCSFAESSKIWSEDITTDPKQLVEGPEGWTSYVGVQGASSEEKRYWTNSKLISEFYQQFPNKTGDKWNKGYTFIYANGNPITIEQGSTADLVKISVDNTDDVLEVETSKNPVVFGGSKNATVPSSKITMKSGKVMNLFGGGYGESNGSTAAATAQPAVVTGNTVINVSGGEAHNIIGGGLYYSKSNTVNITISKVTMDAGAWLMCGGMESGLTYGTAYDEFAKSNNTVETAHLNIDGGTYSYIAIGGTDGNRGYVKQSTAVVKNATITGGVFGNASNGRSDNVVGTLTNCKFEGSNLEIAAVNRGIAKNVSLSFEGCTFPETGVLANLGATYEWQKNYNSSTSKIEGIPGEVSFSFENCVNAPVVGVSDGLETASITLTGTKGKVAKFQNNANAFTTAFTIGEGKTWTFNGGLEFATEDNAATLTNNGTLNVKGIDNVADLQAAVAVSANNIGLEAGTYELASHLLIAKPISIEGTITDKDSTIIKAASNWSGSDNETKNLVRIDASKTSLKNLLVEGCTSGSGIHVFKATGVTLDNVISRNNLAAGLIVNGSAVTATNFRTSGNGWYGVNVDKGQDVTETPVFTIGTGCSFAEAIAIKSDAADAPASYVVGNGWFKTKQDGASIWVNGAASGLNFAITSVPATVVYGQANLPLLTNVDSAYYKANKVNIAINNTDVANIVGDSLQILKPGEAVLTLSVGDTAVTQSLTVLKKTLTITGITAETKAYDGSKSVTLKTDSMKVAGLVGDHSDVVTVPTTGEALSADAGIQPVKVTATLKNNGTNYGEYYELADIIGVMDTITKVKLTYKTTAPEAVSFGEVSTRTFAATLVESTAFVNNEDSTFLGGKLQFDCPATNTSLAGKYPVMPYGYTSNNYEITYKADSLQINAVAPKAEITGVKINSVGESASITVSGRVLSNGGTPTDSLKATITPETGGSGTATTVNVAKDGTFSVKDIKLSAAKYTVKLTVKAGESLTSTEVSSGEVDLAAKLQNVNFTSVPTRMTYGSTAGIAAASTEADAKLVYKIEGGAIQFNSDSTEVEAIQAGEATVTITATKDQYVTAVATQTIKVEPKLVTVTAKAEDKVYDGKLDAKVSFTAEGILEKDKSSVTLSAASVTGAFTDKNASERVKTVILKGECSLNGNVGNYVLAQPANPTAKISKAKISAISASEVKRSYKTASLSYKLDIEGLAQDESVSTPGLYTGTIRLEEKTPGNYTIIMDGVTFRNYDYTGVTLATGTVEIIKGVPTIVTYNDAIANNKVAGSIVDNGGWDLNASNSKLEIVTADNNKAYAKLTYDGTSTVIGNTVNTGVQDIPAVQISLADQVPTSLYSRKAPMTKAGSGNLCYGEEKVLSISGNGIVENTFTVESTTPSVLTVYKKDTGNSYYVKGTGAGTGAILIKVGDAVVSQTIKVDQAELTVNVSGNNKEYDGTTTANIALQLSEAEGASLDLDGVSFNYASKDAGDKINILPSKDIILKGDNADNYKLDIKGLGTGAISKRTLTLTSQVSKYYDGTETIDLTDYSATGLLTEEAAPIITATFTTDANVGLDKPITLALKGNNANYVLANEGNTATGNISKSTLEATLPEKASSANDLKNKITYVVHETGEAVKANTGISQYVTVTGSNPFYVTAADNENCVIIVNNAAVTKSDPVTPPSGGDEDETVTITLDATTKDLPRTEEFILTATVSPAGKTVIWSSSDPTVASVTADGNKVTVKGVKVGTATITATIGDVTATCEVTVGFATGLEEALANTEVFGRKGNIYVNPIQPLQVTVVNMIGKIVYNARISGNTQIPVTKGIYIVKLTNAGNSIVTKVNVY